MRELVTVTGRLSGSVSHGDAAIHVVLSGFAETEALDPLEQLLARIHAEAMRHRVHEVLVDIKKLELMSSSCFRIVLTWITDIEDLAPAARYRVKVISDPNVPWQNRSLDALRSFAADIVSVVKA